MKIILGSSSPFRKRVLEEAGTAFEVVSPDIDEKKIRAADHVLTPVILSFAKACAVAEKVTEAAVIIACDQIIVCDGIIIEKPESPEEVRRWYALYPKHPVHYVNGLTVLNTDTNASLTAQDIAVTTFKDIPDSFTEAQIKKGIIFNCAGGISDEVGDAYATIIQGSKESLVGLPVALVMDMITRVQ